MSINLSNLDLAGLITLTEAAQQLNQTEISYGTITIPNDIRWGTSRGIINTVYYTIEPNSSKTFKVINYMISGTTKILAVINSVSRDTVGSISIATSGQRLGSINICLNNYGDVIFKGRLSISIILYYGITQVITSN